MYWVLISCFLSAYKQIDRTETELNVLFQFLAEQGAQTLDFLTTLYLPMRST